tara:strand:- start:570 stop:830 length:261 start_codon:yes stop_codon:yes gene_type:complete
MKDRIDRMGNHHHIDVLRILKDNEVEFNENQYGVHVNMSELSKDVLEKIYTYIEYVERQNKELEARDQLKNYYEEKYFNREEEEEE